MNELANPWSLEPPEASPGPAGLSPVGGAPRGVAEEHRRPAPGIYLPWVFLLYGVAFLCPGGVGAFSFAFMSLFQFQFPEIALRDTFWQSLIAASWLANPALWVGTAFLVTRQWRSAKWAGFVALLLGFLAAYPGVLMIAYWVWIGSMVLFLVAAYGCDRDSAAARLRKQMPVDPDF